MAEQLDLGFSVGEMTHVPDTDWTPPGELPDRLWGDVAVDLETNDRGLQEGVGPGWAWEGGGYVVGYAVAADNFRGYLPIRHEGGGNLDAGVVRRWLNHVLTDEDQDKVFAKASYDLGWARRDGVEIRGRCWDVQWAEALLDEHRWGYALNGLAKTYLNEEKDEALLRDAARAYGVDPKSGLWRLPAPLVGPYGEGDADLTLRVWREQRPKIDQEGLWPVMELEHDLLPMYLDMRWRGVRIDEDRAVQLRDQWKTEVDETVAEIRRRTGVRVDIWAAASIAKAFDAEGLSYGVTDKTRQPSITKHLLETTDHWLASLILRARERDKMAGTFMDGQILGHVKNGRVHGEIHPLRSDRGGTTTGRLSMSDPNLQFIPTRTEEGKEIRRCFLSEVDELWASADFSQQEPKLLVHFASLTRVGGEPLPGAIEARDRMRSDPDMSYHDFAAELTGLDYKKAKILNLAIIYGRGVRTTAEELGLPQDEVQEMFAKHHEEMPFAKGLSEVCQRTVRERGYLRSLMGRRVRFPLWEPAAWDMRDGRMFPRWRAKKVWPNTRLVRARIHKALNSLIQPSAADQTKMAMREVWRAGLGKHVLIQVHDELCCSVPDRGVAEQIRECMRDAIKLEVPVKVDLDVSDRWEGAET